MNKNEFLDRLQAARQQWDQFLAHTCPEPQVRGTPAEQFSAGPNPGGWNMKDVVAHVTWYDKEMVDVLRTRTLAGSDWWDLPLDDRNYRIYQEYRAQPLEEVLLHHRQVYVDLWRLAQQLTDEDLNDPTHFSGMPADWKPWEMIASNTYDHYLEHMKPGTA